MITWVQLTKNKRRKRRKKIRTKSLEGCPQKRGRIIKLDPLTPRKPNSAIRQCMWVRLSNKKKILAFIPGIFHTLLKHNHVLIRGGRVKDIPGCKFKAMRGLLDFRGVIDRKTAKTKYGVKQTIEMRRALSKPYIRKLLW